MQPNIIYMHSHDTGRYVSPYGHSCETPNLQNFAEKATLFRQAFCACPTCSPSRAALLTGQAPHNAGMFGLAHRGWSLNDYNQHIVNVLKTVGYETALSGTQHVDHSGGERIGYDHLLKMPEGKENHNLRIAKAAVDLLGVKKDKPFFLAVGYGATHRGFPEPACDSPQTDPRFVKVPACLPETPEIRHDTAAYNTLVRLLDDCMGQVLQAVKDNGHADNTLIVITTDHGIAFPLMKCNLTDHGAGVMLMIKGPASLSEKFSDGRAVDALVSHIDLYPTLCEAAGAAIPAHCQGLSLWPVLRGEAESIRDEVFAEVTFHAAYEPMRSVRTGRFKYIRRWDLESHPTPRLSNIDASPSKTLFVESGFPDRPYAEHELYDLFYDPQEQHNVAGSDQYADVLADMQARLKGWMVQTADPLREGPVEPVSGAIMCRPDAKTPSDTYVVD